MERKLADMRRNNIIGWLTTCLLLLCLTTTTTVNADSKPITDADVVKINENPDNTELIVSYVLEDKKDLIFKTSEANVIDLAALKEELGSDKVKIDSDKKEVTVTLDQPNKIDFVLKIDNKKPFKLEALDTDHNELFHQNFNDQELEKTIEKATKDISESDFDPDDQGWIATKNLRVSAGPVLPHKDGTISQPYLYFGDYEQASIRQLIADAYSPKGKARQNSLTAANFAVLYAEKGSRLEDGLDSPTNHIYTSHFGDNQSKDIGFYPLGIEDQPHGSPNSFISNNLYNSIEKTDKWLRPGTSGPDKNGYSYAMAGKPILYYRVDPKTGYEEQKLSFVQKAYPVDKNGRENRKLNITINMHFNNSGKIVTKVTFKNIGDRLFNNFSGFSSHDLSLNKDGKEIEKAPNPKDFERRPSNKEKKRAEQEKRKIGNYVPMRALGHQRGMYIESGNKEMRTSIFTNHPNGPHAWAARSIGRSYVANKGFMKTPGLGPVLETKERYYPWKSGKPKSRWFGLNHTVFYNSLTDRYDSPFVPEYKFNAFGDQHGFGDKGTAYAEETGHRLGAEFESEPLWDAGFTMRTAPQDLKPEQTVELEYASQININGKTDIPVIELDHQGTPDDPELIPISNE